MQGVDLFITITDRSRAEQFAAWFRTHGISLVLTALGQGTATTEVLDLSGPGGHGEGRAVLRVAPVPPAGAAGGPGPVAGCARPGRFDDCAGEQHRRIHRQGISAA